MGTLVLILGAVVLRAGGAGLRAAPARLLSRLFAWLLAGGGAWFAAGAAGAWAPLWPAGLAVVLTPLDRRGRALPLRVGADAVLVAGFAVLSTPPLEPLRLVVAALLFAGTGLLCDLALAHPRIPRRAVRWAPLPAALGIVAFLALTLVPAGTPNALTAAVSLHSGVMPAALPGTRRITLDTGAVAWLDRPPGAGPFPGALFFHGAHFKASHQPSALAFRRALLAAGFVVLAVDHPGYGESPHPAPDAAVAAWDPLPTEIAAYEALRAVPGIQGIVAVGQSMGNGTVLRLLEAGVPLASAVVSGAGLITSERAAYWDERFLRDRRITAPMAPGRVRELRGRYYDNRGNLDALPAAHPPVQFVTFGIEWPNIVATRDAFYARLPGPKTRTDLPGTTHYLSTFGRRGVIIGDVRAARELTNVLRPLARRAADRAP